MNKQLLRLVASQLRVGAPLPFGVRDEHGKLLLAKGQVIASDSQLETLLERGLYADKEELEAANQQSAADADARRSTIFDIWEQQIWALKRLLASLAEADFAAR